MHNYRSRHFPEYFSHGMRREVSELFASASIADFAIGMMLLFEPIYFVTVLGWSVAGALLFFAAVYFLYIILLPLGGKITARWGVEHAMMYAIPFQIAYWILLASIPSHPWLAVGAVVALAIEKTLYWPPFHAEMARYSDKDQRSREFSLVYAIVHIVYILGPFVGGLISQHFGVRMLLIVASAVYFTMFIPLFTTPEKHRRSVYRFSDTLRLFRSRPREAVAYAGYGEELLLLVVWPIFIFTVLPDFLQLGALVATATLLSTAFVFYVGKLSDAGKRREVLFLGACISIFVWLIRPFVATAGMVFAADTVSRSGRDSFYVPLLSSFYDRAEEEKILPYVIFFEQSLSIGKLVAALLGALLFTLTQSFVPLFVLGALFTALYLVFPPRKRSMLAGHILKP